MGNSFSFPFQLQTRTPIWTGDAKNECRRLHETGLIGSLRWWLEVVVRGLGGRACDPTAKGKGGPNQNACSFDSERYARARRNEQGQRSAAAEAGLCPACQIFGATGWRKIFRLELVEDSAFTGNSIICFQVSKDQKRATYLPGGFYSSHIAARLVFDRDPLTLKQALGLTPEDLTEAIKLALCLISEWGGLAAKTQQGYGVVDIDCGNVDVAKAIWVLEAIGGADKPPQELPCLDDFFFTKIRFRLSGVRELTHLQSLYTGLDFRRVNNWFGQTLRWEVFPVAPVVRYYLRDLFRSYHNDAFTRYQMMGVVSTIYHSSDGGKVTENNKRWRCEVCGEEWKGKELPRADVTKLERQRSRIHVSQAYILDHRERLYEMRVWGEIPKALANRDKVVQSIKEWLGKDGELWARMPKLKVQNVIWRMKQGDQDTRDFLVDLLRK